MLFLLFVFTCSFQSDMIIIYWIKCKLQKAELDLKIIKFETENLLELYSKLHYLCADLKRLGVGVLKIQTYLLHIVKLPNSRDLRSAQVSAAVKMS